MTQEFRHMLSISAMGATGRGIMMPPEEIDWEKVVDCARKQKVDCYLAYALKKNKEIDCPAEIRETLVKHARSLVFSNALHRSAIVKLLEEMEEAGLRGVLLKGYAISDCYAIPESRISGDVDIWIDAKDEKAACKFMQEKGFTVSPRWENGHHAVCHHPQLGHVELHVLLYDEIVEEIWFGMKNSADFVKEKQVFLQTEDGSFYTLGYTDHMIFLALHMIKHFILSGFTLQMMLDIALFFRKHAEKIDSDRLWATLKSLHYEKAFGCVLWAMIRYCGFEKGDFPGISENAPDQVEELLTDLEKGGWMGNEDLKARKQGWHEYNREIMLKTQSKTKYLWHMTVWNLGLLKTALFPPLHKIYQRCPYAKKSPVLVPVAWLHRFFMGAPKAIKNGDLTKGIILDETKLGDVGKKRTELFRELEMM